MAPGKSEGAESSTAELLGGTAFQAPSIRNRNIAFGAVAPPEQTTHGRIGPPVNRLRGAERPSCVRAIIDQATGSVQIKGIDQVAGSVPGRRWARSSGRHDPNGIPAPNRPRRETISDDTLTSNLKSG
jgi:hypothetical protein